MSITDDILFMQSFNRRLHQDFIEQQNSVFEKSFIDAGIDIKDAEQCKRVTRVVRERDGFEHYYLDYGTQQEKRIISFEKNATISNEFDVVGNKYTVRAETKYY